MSSYKRIKPNVSKEWIESLKFKLKNEFKYDFTEGATCEDWAEQKTFY